MPEPVPTASSGMSRAGRTAARASRFLPKGPQPQRIHLPGCLGLNDNCSSTITHAFLQEVLWLVDSDNRLFYSRRIHRSDMYIWVQNDMLGKGMYSQLGTQWLIFCHFTA